LSEQSLQIGDNRYKADDFPGIFIVAIGQAAPIMAEFVFNYLFTKGYKFPIEGCVFTHRVANAIIPTLIYHNSQHCRTDELSESSSFKVIDEMIKHHKKGFHVIALLSDGANDLLNLPETEISLTDNIELNEQMMLAGISLKDITIVKNHISKVKAGKFVKLLQSYSASIFRMSHAIDEKDLNSGICSVDEHSYLDAINILRLAELVDKVPKSIIKTLKNGINSKIVDTLKQVEFDRLDICYLTVDSIETALNNVQFVLESNNAQVFLSHSDFADDMKNAMEDCFETLIFTQIKPDVSSACFLYHGLLKGELNMPSDLGRNQAFCLQLGNRMLKAGFKNFELMVFSSDGFDGSTDVSGAFINEAMYSSEEDKEFAEKCLEENQAHKFFKEKNGLLKFGPTGAAPEDLVFLICQRIKK
jgi:glycerate 2-kinase